MAYNREQYIVRCNKCVIGKDKAGKPVGGVIAATSPGKGVCCACGRVYTIKVKPRVEKPYNPDQYHEMEQSF